jgi:hypothetical protein
LRRATVQVRTWRRPPRKLTPKQIARIMALPWERGSCTALAREFGVSQALISNIRNGLAYKAEQPLRTYSARVTDGRERYSLGTFPTREAAQHAIATFQRTNKWPRGSIERAKRKYRARLTLGTFETRWAAERAIKDAMATLEVQHDRRNSDVGVEIDHRTQLACSTAPGTTAATLSTVRNAVPGLPAKS